MRMMKRIGVCIFCGGEGNLSKEHVFPDWMKQLFPRDSRSTHVEGVINWRDGQPSAPIMKQRLGHSGTRKTRVVCQACNNGWMSRLENDVKPILATLVLGQRNCILRDELRLLAMWAAKSGCVAEHAIQNKAILQTERDIVRAGGIPPNWRVLIFPYSGKEYSELYMWQHSGTIESTIKPGGHRSYRYIKTSLWGMGHVIIYLLSTEWSEAGERLEKLALPRHSQVWPIRSSNVFWNLTSPIGDEDVRSLMAIFDQMIKLKI